MFIRVFYILTKHVDAHLITTKDFYSPGMVLPGFIDQGVCGKRTVDKIDAKKRTPSLKKIKLMSGKVEYLEKVCTTRFYFYLFRSNVLCYSKKCKIIF